MCSSIQVLHIGVPIDTFCAYGMMSWPMWVDIKFSDCEAKFVGYLMFGILMVGSSYFQVVLESNQEERKREETWP